MSLSITEAVQKYLFQTKYYIKNTIGLNETSINILRRLQNDRRNNGKIANPWTAFFHN